MGGGRFELNRFDTWSGSGERDSLSLCEAPDSRHNDAVQRVVYRGRALAYRDSGWSRGAHHGDADCAT